MKMHCDCTTYNNRKPAFYCLVMLIHFVSAINNDSVFTIHTEGCTIPSYPPLDENFLKVLNSPNSIHNCSKNVHLIESNSTHIWIDKYTYSVYNIWSEKEFYCCYIPFLGSTSIYNVTYGDCKIFTAIIPVEHEYVRIECYYSDDKIYEDFIMTTFLETLVNENKENVGYNVVILGIENISRRNFFRTMPASTRFLLDRGFLHLRGYNKVGDNSLPNLFPILTGHSFDVVKRVCRVNNTVNIEVCPFIWDKFKEAGYSTSLASDSTAGLLGHYEFNLPSVPTDFYLQPFIAETKVLFHAKDYDYHQCLQSKYYYKILLKYIHSLLNKLKNYTMFGLFWEETITHQVNLFNPRIMDDDYANLLTAMEVEGFLNTTILIIMSDHGMRWGEIVRTDQGRLEERLPMFGVIFPREFKIRHKFAVDNFERNTKRLITPFDIHATLLHLTDPASLVNDEIKALTGLRNTESQSSSLFLPISEKRTCKSLGIREHWCTCFRGHKLKAGSKAKVVAANELLRHINKLLSIYPQCHKLRLRNILNCFVTKNSGRERIYTVVIETFPGSAIFDATLIRYRRSWTVSGIVSRLNLYNNDSYCVENSLIKYYCFCKLKSAT